MDIRPILSTLMRHKTAASLIVIEIALTCAIICNALFMISDRIREVREVSGLVEDELVRVQILSIGSDADQSARTRTDLANLRAISGVKDATVLNQVPFVNSSWNSGVRLAQEQQQSTLSATTYMAEDQFIETLGLKLVAGRDFNPDEYQEASDLLDGLTEDGSVPGAIITRSLADKLYPGEDAVGKSFYSWGDKPIRVIGVVEHLVRPSQMGGPSAREYSMVFPLRPHYNLGGNYVIRTSPERRAEVLAAAKKTLLANGADRIILEDNSKTVEELRHEFFQAPRAMAWLLGIVCVALLLITALGIIGLASFWVQQRTKQIGVRRALGATRGQILRYFQTENFLLATIGIAVGMLLAFAINQLLMGKYEMARLPLFYLPAGAVLLWALGQLAVWAPARRAASIPPAVATRSV
ncbi:ABC transporter permease [Pseudoxanthomonas kaohsiungensis]|uniref:ABC transporter permease n=1 Tax=Pseudoxanthomonas kaohsiungensis TaxID=283923 RepID=A0ABW3LQX7_9GAMM|nr:FtsX-like permease family protein [Pseudoxanthomonas kaohsiungensis]KAF1704211.1 ABC transporter permease [Pseudoxanthomonas kaohsiungensis]